MLQPTEYYYLTKPIEADSASMLKYTIQDLCLRQVLKVELKRVIVDKRDKRKRLRFFLGRGKEFDSYKTFNKYENFILKLFDQHEELKFTSIRLYVREELKDDAFKFKRDYVFPVLKRKGLCFWRIFPTSKGRKLRDEITEKIDWIEFAVDSLLESHKEHLITELKSLDSNILFLSDETLEKLKAISEVVAMVSKLEFLNIYTETIGSNDDYIGMDTGFGGSYGSFGGSFGGGGGGGGFSGFGGGSFGGGGAGGSW